MDGIIEELRRLKVYTEQDTYEKIKGLGETGARAHRVAMMMTVSTLLFGIIISIFITKSITRPLSFMKKRPERLQEGILRVT